MFVQQLHSVILEREIRVFPEVRPPVVIASDGRLDDSAPASVAVLLFDPLSGLKLAWVAILPPELIARWRADSEQYIALVEQAAVMMGILHASPIIRGRDLLWFEDNSVVLSGLVRGASSSGELDSGCSCIHLSLAMLKVRAWWEYVESKSNWADGPSRGSDDFLVSNSFRKFPGSIPMWPWTVAADERVALLRQLFKT